MNPTTAAADLDGSFAARLRAETRGDHRDAERSDAMADLLAGRLDLPGYAALLAQLLPVYEALEAAGRDLSGDPVAGSFMDPVLDRAPSLRLDLEVLPPPHGDGRPTAATAAYVDRLDAVAGDPVGLVAHHYTRYLGDLSGGQHIGRLVERHLGVDAATGTSWFHFGGIVDVDVYKDRYRARLDAAPWGPADRDRFVDEVRTAYRLNRELLSAVPRG